MNKLTLSQVEIFVVVTRLGSFSAASLELDCTQSRISHAIGELERQVNGRLLIRSRTGCVPTGLGHKVLAQAQLMVSLADEIAQAGRANGEIEGFVRVASIRSVVTHVLPHAVEALSRSYPKLHIEIFDNCDNYAKVDELVRVGAADIGITRVTEQESAGGRPFISDPYVVVAPASLALQSPACTQELAGLPYIGMQQPGSAWILDQCRAAGFALGATRWLSNESGIVALVRRGLGYTVMPRLTVFPDSSSTQTLLLPFPARRQLRLITCDASANRRCVQIAVAEIMNKASLTLTDAWRADVIQIDF